MKAVRGFMFNRMQHVSFLEMYKEGLTKEAAMKKAYPLVTFKSRSVKAMDQTNFEVIGDIMLLGNTRTVTIDVVHIGGGMDPWGKFRRGFETTFSIMRKDFGMDFMSMAVGGNVVLTISVQGIRG